MRAKPDDTIEELVVKMAEGNPGAVTVLAKMLRRLPRGFFLVLLLDEWEIYGPSIWVLYKDGCGEDIETLMNLLEDTARSRDVDALRKKAERH